MRSPRNGHKEGGWRTSTEGLREEGRKTKSLQAEQVPGECCAERDAEHDADSQKKVL